jgi:hypothetical protein
MKNREAASVAWKLTFSSDDVSQYFCTEKPILQREADGHWIPESVM